MRPLYPYILHHYFLPILYAANFLVDNIKYGLRPATLHCDRPHKNLCNINYNYIYSV